MRSESPACPRCGAAIGDGAYCPGCGRDLEALRARSEKQPKQPMQCPMCYGTGRNKHGGPCGYCQATGQVRGVAAAGATMSAFGGALTSLFWSVIALGIIVFVIYALLTS